MRRTASSPAAMSTPAARYVSEGACVTAPSETSPRTGLRRRSRRSDDPGFTTGSGLEESELRRVLGLHADAVGAGETGVAKMRGVGTGGFQHSVE